MILYLRPVLAPQDAVAHNDMLGQQAALLFGVHVPDDQHIAACAANKVLSRVRYPVSQRTAKILLGRAGLVQQGAHGRAPMLKLDVNVAK